VFSGIFEGAVPRSSRGEVELDETEARLVDAATDAMGEVIRVLGVEGNEAYTLDEKSRLVFDPFPAAVSVEVNGVVEESEGFDREGEAGLSIRPIGLWSALESIESRWTAPDLAVAYVEATRRAPENPFDVGDFAGRPRKTAPAPRSAEVREAIVAALKPRPLYRAVWRAKTAPPESEEEGEAAREKP
jgi:hypothetical protein